jgi:hypothetical protein
MATVTVRFRGICCFIDPTNGEDFKKRVVVPNMSIHQHDMEEHLQIIEFLADDLVPGQDLELTAFTRPGDDGKYQYFRLTEPVKIEFIGASGKEITAGPNLAKSTLHLDALAGGTLQLKGTLLGPAERVAPALAMAVIDLPGGVLMAGPPEATITSFSPPAIFQKRRLSRWLELFTEIADDKFSGDKLFGLRLTSLKKSEDSKEIWFKNSTALVTIANEPERIIVGHFVENQPPSEATGHFDIYWDLISDPPPSRPVPDKFQGTGPGCVPANKP